ncbi:hypothetical protein DL767_000914 [Monosporascus sp. MG133]|nr:hypothetical protein DL767_000914 [Monosporascus sp. MG133]
MSNGDADNPADIDGGPLANNHKSIFAHIERGLLEHPDQPAVICMHQHVDHLTQWGDIDEEFQSAIKGIDPSPRCLTLTYAQLHAGALKLVAGFQANGIRPGSTVLCMIPNSCEYALILWACAILRLTLAAVDPHALGDKHGLAEYLQSLTPAVLLIPHAKNSKVVESAITELPTLLQPCLRLWLDNEDCESPPGWESFRRILETGTLNIAFDEAAVLEDARRDDADRVHSVLFTSGTSTGRPKGCPLHVGAMTHILESQSWLITPDNCARVLQQAHNSRAIGPQHTLQTWRVGGAIVMDSGPSFAIEHTLDALLPHGATFIVLSPSMVHALTQVLPSLPAGTGDSVKTIQVGGDAVTREVLTKCAKLFPRAHVCVNHGMSEGGGFFIWPIFNPAIGKIPYMAEFCPVGEVAPGARIRIWDSKARRVALRQQPGRLHVCCDSLIRGYLGGVDASTFFEDSDGRRWMDTGDVAMVTENDLVYILGRSKDAIVRPRVVIMPAALESCIEKYTKAQACVVAVPDSSLGHEPFAVLSSLNGFTKEQIGSHVTRMLGTEYRLRGVVSLKQIGLLAFPVNATHKVVKFKVQKAVMELIKQNTALE